MAVFNFLMDWYAWALAVPFAGWGLKLLWKRRREIKEYILFIWNFKKRFESLEQKTTNPISSEAKFCPTCDERMNALDTRRFDVWWYKCAKCEKAFQYPAPTLAK